MDEHGIAEITVDVSEAINAAAFGHLPWQDVCSRLLDYFPGAYVALLNQNIGDGTFNFAVLEGIERRSLNSYLQYYASVNPWRRFWQGDGRGEILVTERDDPTFQYRQGEFYRDWMKPMGDYDAAVGMRLQLDNEEVVYLPVHYPTRLSEAYDGALERVMVNLRPSLLNAYRLARLARDVGERQSILSALVGRGNRITFVMDDRLKVREANETAIDAFAKGYPVACRHGRLHLVDTKLEQRLTRWLSEASFKPQDQCETFVLKSEKGAWTGAINQLPLVVLNGLIAPRPLYLFQLREIAAPHRPSRSLLVAAFGLTPVEVALCCSLAEGRSVEEAALDNRISFENARQRLKSIFRKLGINRQVELANILQQF